MANSAVETHADHDRLVPAPNNMPLWEEVQWLLRPVASLKLTVVLFAMAIFIVLAGTLAQVDKDIWEVINGYFRIDFSSPGSALRTSVVWIPLQIFFPPSFFPSRPQIPGGFPFPSGWLIGIAMSINLIAAHLVRFRIQARGGRLLGGVALIAAGILVTAMVIASGSNQEGFQQAAWLKWSTLWWLFKLGLLVAWLAMLYGWSRMLQSSDKEVQLLILVGVGVGLLGAFLGWLLYRGDSAMLGDSSMRILWQLLKGLLAGGVLLGGCIMVFKKRAGIVLLHAGILLMMAGEVLVGTAAVEGQMQIGEGQTVNFVQDVRSVELAFATPAGPEEDDVVVIPESILLRGGKIQHELLPFDVELVKDGYFKNSDLRPLKPEDENRATAGAGLRQIAEPARASSGTDMSGRVDLASAYVKLTKKGTSLGTYLVSQWLEPEVIVEDTPPKDWEARSQPPSMALLAYGVKQDGEQADVTVTRLRGSAGGLEANLARWRSQVGLDAVAGEDAETDKIELDGDSAVYVDLAAPASAGPARRRILGMIAEHKGQTWFLKMMGPYDLVESQKATFETWARSVRFDSVCAVSLRFKRTYKPYSVQLLDVRKDDYIGTDTPRNYSSDIRLVDATRHVDRKIHIWMNNPLRYAGETFYQSNYHRDPQTGMETTGLQVVTNTGWMIPYVACMIVVTALLFHFGIALVRFLNRRASSAVLDVPEPAAQNLHNARRALAIKSRKQRDFAPRPEATSELGVDDRSDPMSWLVPVAVVALFAAFVISRARPPHAPANSMQIHEFGKLPVAYEGRVKPFDTLARTTLRVMSNKETFRDRNDDRQPAIRWLLDVISGAPGAEQHRVFRIDNPEVLDTLGLKPRKGYCYSVEDISGGIKAFEKQADLAHSVPAENLSVYQRKVLDLDRRIRTYTLLLASFRPPIPQLPSKEEIERNPDALKEEARRFQQVLLNLPRQLESMNPPLAVPVRISDKPNERQWKPYATAWAAAFLQSAQDQQPDPATTSLNTILAAYAAGDVSTFNNEVKAYSEALQNDPPEGFHWSRGAFEAYFNHLSGFLFSAWFYLVAFVLAALGWLGWSRPLNRAAFWLIVATLGLHTFSLIGRIYISGRPPVTNLYSSAIFISWGCVVLGLVLEMVYRVGIGNVLAGVGGFATLYIAHLLTTAVPSFRGDTFTVMQAVLDTQFWLATHVVCITLGYATTYVAGLLGILYVVLGVFTPKLTPKLERDLVRMIYGTVCFALFFSFFGTVLGGLWADDSWGRFWGWDPKENGALIIVLWNALVLHARWDGMARQRGLALLAVGGNIAVSWSWFGVNELGVGLHSYGFTEGVLMTLLLFVVSQSAVIAVGALPKDLWCSFRRRGAEEAAA